MVEDEILRDVWRNRDAFAKRHHYDLDAMVEELRRMERQSSNKLARLADCVASPTQDCEDRAQSRRVTVRIATKSRMKLWEKVQ